MDLPAHQMKLFLHDSETLLHARWRSLLMQGGSLVLLGLLAIALPVLTTLAVDVVIGSLLFFGGGWRLIAQLRMTQHPGFAWYVALSGMAIVFGAAMLLAPPAGIRTLTALLFAFFVLEGIGQILFALDLRTHAHEWGSPLMTGVLDIGLALLIVAGWPGTAAWALGLLVGINMLFFGLSLIIIALAARRGRHRDLRKIALADLYVSQKKSSSTR
jgi:uncharacterized membrane protein HdeD (DUF308 family)